MAKKKQPSISKIINTVKTENVGLSSRIDELEKDVKSLETTALAIMEILRRNKVMERSGEDQKNIKKESKTVIKDKQYDLDPDLPLGEYYKNVLMKIYTFMTKNAEKEKKEKDTQKGLKKEHQNERKRKYEKVEKKLDSKKKKGFLGTVGYILKWGFLGSIGVAISGLVWLFYEEVSSFGKKIIENLVVFGDSITKLTNFVKTMFERVKNFLKDSPLGKVYEDITKWFNDLNIMENVKSNIDSAMKYIDKNMKTFSDYLIDSITKWCEEIARPLIRFYSHPFESIANFIANHPKVMLGFAAKFATGPFGVAAKGMAALSAFDTAKTGFQKESIKARYSDKYYTQTEEALKPFTDEELWDKFGNIIPFIKEYRDFDGKLDREKLINDIINKKEVREKIEKSIASDKTSPLYKKSEELWKKLQERDDQLIEDVQKELGENYAVRHNGKGGYTVTDVSTGEEIGTSDDLDLAIKRASSKLKGSMEESRQGYRQQAFDYKDEKIKEFDEFAEQKKREWDLQVALRDEEIHTKYGHYFEEFDNKKAQLEEKSEEVKSSVSSSLSALKTNPEQIISSAASAVWQPTKKGIEKGLDTVTKIDYLKESTELYDKIESLFGKVSKQVESGELVDNFKSKLDKMVSMQRNVEVGEDPSSNPLALVSQNVDRFNEQLRGMMNNTIQTNVSSRNAGDIDMTPMPVRDRDINRWTVESNLPHLK